MSSRADSRVGKNLAGLQWIVEVGYLIGQSVSRGWRILDHIWGLHPCVNQMVNRAQGNPRDGTEPQHCTACRMFPQKIQER